MQDTIIPDGKWSFDDTVTACFTDMLERSIPQYDLMRELCFKIGSEFVTAKSCIVDVGCANGLAVEPFIRNYGALNHFILMDMSEPMLEECRKRYEGYIQCGVVDIQNSNLIDAIHISNASLILSILTVQFTPIEYRQQIITRLYEGLNSNGVLLYVEKVLGNGQEIGDVLVRQYYGMKSDNGYTQEAIKAKRKSLEGVLVPITAKWNEELLQTAGFKKIDCFWRCLNFAGWIAIK